MSFPFVRHEPHRGVRVTPASFRDWEIIGELNTKTTILFWLGVVFVVAEMPSGPFRPAATSTCLALSSIDSFLDWLVARELRKVLTPPRD